MKKDRVLIRSCTLPLLALLFSLVSFAPAAELIFQETFSGSNANPLNGTAPDTAPGAESWLAAGWAETGLKATTGDQNAFLPFSPLPGKVYRLSADLDPDISGSSEWFALGFTGGNSTGIDFWQPPNNAAPWVLMRMDDTLANVARSFGGFSPSWFLQDHDFTPDKVGPVNFEVRLDTTFANWGVQWFADGELLRSFNYGSNPTITHVGFGGIGDTTGSVSNFRLQEGFGRVPEPSTSMFILVGAAALSFRRRLSRELLSRKR